MKILHTSDWHLGHQFYKYDRDEEFQYALRQIVEIVGKEQPDAFVLSGDVYDTPSPSTMAQRCFTQAILSVRQACPTMTVIVIAGNHDGKSFLSVNRELWSLANVHVVGLLDRTDVAYEMIDHSASDVELLSLKFDLDAQVVRVGDKGIVVAVPHLYDTAYPFLSDPEATAEQRRRQYFSALMEYVGSRNPERLPVVLMAHTAIASSDLSWHDFGMVGSLVATPQSDFGTGYDYLALGHIHKAQNMIFEGRLARYSGSIIPISFSEELPHSVSIVDVKPDATTVEDVTKVEIAPLYTLLTLPATPLPFEQALRCLDTVGADRRCYLRLNVSVDGENPLPPDALVRVHHGLKDKMARFCEFKINSLQGADQAGRNVLDDPSQLRVLTPLQVAEYASPTPLSNDFRALFAEVEDVMRRRQEQEGE